MNSSLYNDFKTFSKLVEENENENVTTNKILGSLEIFAIKNGDTFIRPKRMQFVSDFTLFDRENFERS